MRTSHIVVALGLTCALLLSPGCKTEKPSAEPFITAGKSHLDTQSVPEALAEFTKAVGVDSTNAEAYYYKGLAESRLGMDMAAMKSYNRSLELDSLNARAYADRGGLRVMIQDYRGAVADLDPGPRA